MLALKPLFTFCPPLSLSFSAALRASFLAKLFIYLLPSLYTSATSDHHCECATARGLRSLFIVMGQELLSLFLSLGRKAGLREYRALREERPSILHCRVKGTGYRGRSWTADRDATATTTTTTAATAAASPWYSAFLWRFWLRGHVFPRY